LLKLSPLDELTPEPNNNRVTPGSGIDLPRNNQMYDTPGLFPAVWPDVTPSAPTTLMNTDDRLR
jgi:hypothetical protein